MLYRRGISRTDLKRGMLFTAVVLGLAQVALAATPTTTVAPLILSGRQSARPAGTYSAGITEIIKMLDAKVDAQVILAYIQNSPIPYNPEATELIAVQEHGASTELLIALLHHGDELGLQLAQPQSAADPPLAAPPYDYGPEAAYPAYPYSYPGSSDAPYPATEYSYASGWPLAYLPSISIGGYCPYWHAPGHCPAPHGHGFQLGNDSHRNWFSGARRAPQAPPSASAPSRGRTGVGAARPAPPPSRSVSAPSRGRTGASAARPAPQPPRSVSAPSRGRTDGSAARPAPQASRSVSAPSRARTGSPVVHSGGSRGSGRSGGRSGGRSR